MTIRASPSYWLPAVTGLTSASCRMRNASSECSFPLDIPSQSPFRPGLDIVQGGGRALGPRLSPHSPPRVSPSHNPASPLYSHHTFCLEYFVQQSALSYEFCLPVHGSLERRALRSGQRGCEFFPTSIYWSSSKTNRPSWWWLRHCRHTSSRQTSSGNTSSRRPCSPWLKMAVSSA